MNDFGFTAVDEEEISGKDSQDRLRALFEKLLSNLEKNPDKDYIKWPNRADHIAQIRDNIANICD